MNQSRSQFEKAASDLFSLRSTIKTLQDEAEKDRKIVLEVMSNGETQKVGRLQVTCYVSDTRTIDLDDLRLRYPRIYDQLVGITSSYGVRITEQERRAQLERRKK